MIQSKLNKLFYSLEMREIKDCWGHSELNNQTQNSLEIIYSTQNSVK